MLADLLQKQLKRIASLLILKNDKQKGKSIKFG